MPAQENGKSSLIFFRIRRSQHLGAGQTPLTLGILTGSEVASAGAVGLHLAAARYLEAFRYRFSRFGF
jgi:hypothetical protein